MAMMNIGEVLPQVGRKWRRPKHTFNLANNAYQIQPFLLAPVLPGETLKQLLIQSRVVSDPISNPLIGWWCEYYIFYVKHRDLAQRDLMVQMMLEPGSSTAALNDPADVLTYHASANQPNWALKCLQVCVEHYFRDEDESWNSALFGTLPIAHALSAGENWMDTLVVDAAMPDIDPNDTSMQALEPQQAQWEYLRAMKLTDMTYEQWLGTYGVNVPQAAEAHKPELIRYLREWTYPANTIDPVTGAPSSALSWSIAERADKDRFFREPGWIFGVTVIRPKVYYGNQVGSAADMMTDAMSWLPAIMKDQPWTSLKQMATGAGVVPGITDVGGYWFDYKDLLLYGDQFFNFANSGAAKVNAISIPSTTGGRRYPTAADVTNMFKTAGKEMIRQDGVVSLAVLGTQQDTT